MKILGPPTFASLIVAVATYALRPSPSMLAACIGLCLAVCIIVGWSCAIRERQFSVFGLIGLKADKPLTANLSNKEGFAFRYAAAALIGVLVGTAICVLYGVA